MVICTKCKDHLENSTAVQQQQSQAPPRPSQSTSFVRCPTCRNFGHFRVDPALTERIAKAPTIRCRYVGCNADAMPLGAIAKHEASCPMIKVKCRYATWGCAFVGPQRDIAHHEEHDCALAKIGFLIQQHMNLSTGCQQALLHLRQRQEGNSQMIHMLQQQFHTMGNERVPAMVSEAVAAASSSMVAMPSNVLHVMEFVISLCTKTLNTSSVRWKLWTTKEARATVSNQLMLLPIILLAVRLCLREASYLASVPSKRDEESFVANVILEALMISFTSFLGLAVLIVSFLLDRTSPLRWRPMPLKKLGEHKIGSALASVGSVLLYGLIFLDTRFEYVCLKYVLATTTTLMPPIFVLVFMKEDLPSSAPTQVETWKHVVFLGRAAEPVLMGLWLGFAWGPSDTVAPEILLLLALTFLALSHSNIPRRISLPIIGIASATFAALVKFTSDAIDPTSLLLFILWTAMSLIFQRLLAIGMYYIATSRLCPLRELVLLACIFGWSMLLAI